MAAAPYIHREREHPSHTCPHALSNSIETGAAKDEEIAAQLDWHKQRHEAYTLFSHMHILLKVTNHAVTEDDMQ